MLKEPPLRMLPSSFRIVFLFSLMILSMSTFMQLGELMLYPVFGVQEPEKFMGSPELQVQHFYASLWLQSLSSGIGAFLLPSLMFAALTQGNVRKALKVDSFPSFQIWSIALLIMLAAMFFIALPSEWNRNIPIPEAMKSMQETQEKFSHLIDGYFREITPLRFGVLFLALAVLPALAEEFFFRGTLIPLLRNSGLSSAAAILTSALAFSLMHFEIYNVLPIFLMGALLGWLFHITGNLWISILAHGFNNGLHLVLKLLYFKSFFETDPTEEEHLPWYVTLPALGVLIVLLYLYPKRITPPTEPTEI